VTRAVSRYPAQALVGAVCLGLAAANLSRAPALAIVLLASAVLAAAAARVPPEARLLILMVALALAGWWWGSFRLDVLDRSVLAEEAGEAARARVVVTAPVRRTRFAQRVRADVRRFGRRALDETVLLELPLGRSPPQGAVLELVGEIRLPRPVDDGFDESAWLRRQGIHVVLRGSYWRAVGKRGGVGGLADRLRGHLARTIAPGLRGERRAVVAGIVLGEDEGLSENLRDSFRASGLYHLLAVSGQNVVFLAGGVLLLAWLLGVPRMLGELGVLAAIGGYVLAVGWQPSVVRAGVAGALASLAWLAARPRDRWHFLLLGAAVLLAWNPYSLLEPGFQLSFTAVGAIFLLVPRLERGLAGYPVPRVLAAVTAVSAGCSLVTAPILWLHFGAVPLFSVMSNALAAPVAAPLLGLGLAAAGLEPVLPEAAIALAWCNGWLAAYLAACAEAVAALPFAQVTSWTGVLVASAGAAAMGVLPRLRAHERNRVLALGAVVLVAGTAWRLVPERVLPPPSGLRITVLDVGQGDAVLLQVPSGAILVDQGPPEAHVADQLRRLGVRRLALLVLTHPQRDHVGGAAEVLEELDVDRVLDPRIPAGSADQAGALAAARRRRVPVVAVHAGQEYRLGRLRLRVLWPDEPGPPGQDPNTHATVLLASYGEVDALLTADAEGGVTVPLRPPPAEILKVAHHGSADPFLPRLLDAVRPRVAVVSVVAGTD